MRRVVFRHATRRVTTCDVWREAMRRVAFFRGKRGGVRRRVLDVERRTADEQKVQCGGEKILVEKVGQGAFLSYICKRKQKQQRIGI